MIQTAGSIISPAEVNCIVGLKPTRGLVANDGCVPISHRQDVVGPMTRTVREAAHMLNILAGRNEADDFTWNIPFDPIPDFTASCQTTNLKGVKIGIPRNTFIKVADPILTAFETALKTLAEAGADIIENTDFESVEEFKNQDAIDQSFCISAEFKSDLAIYFAGLKNNPLNIKTMKDLIAYTKSFPGEQYSDRDIEKFLWTQAKGTDISSLRYKELMEQDQYFGGAGGILGAMEKHDLDLIAIPSTIEIPTVFAAKMGFPILSVPLGFYPEDTKIEMNKRGNLVQTAPGIP
jgi:amidase